MYNFIGFSPQPSDRFSSGKKFWHPCFRWNMLLCSKPEKKIILRADKDIVLVEERGRAWTGLHESYLYLRLQQVLPDLQFLHSIRFIVHLHSACWMLQLLHFTEIFLLTNSCFNWCQSAKRATNDNTGTMLTIPALFFTSTVRKPANWRCRFFMTWRPSSSLLFEPKSGYSHPRKANLKKKEKRL